MTVGELAAICGIPSAVTVAIVGFFVWLLERSIVKRETARAEEDAKREKAREAEEAKLEAERTKQENSRKVFEEPTREYKRRSCRQRSDRPRRTTHTGRALQRRYARGT